MTVTSEDTRALASAIEAAAAAGDHGRALDLARTFTRRAPDVPAAWLARAGAAFAFKADAETLLALRHARVLAPHSAEVLERLTPQLLRHGQLAEALDAGERWVDARPTLAAAHFALGNVQLRARRFEPALRSYERAARLEPDRPAYRFAPASVYLCRGDYAPGWQAYEERLGMRVFQPAVDDVFARLWDGSPLAGRRLLVHVEQGNGDTLQFLRYLPLLRDALGADAEIGLLVQKRLKPLAATVGGYSRLWGAGEGGTIAYDVQIPLLSLPHRFGTLVESIPAAVPYLTVPAGVPSIVPDRRDARLRVGLVWAGNPDHPEDPTRSCPLEHLAALFDLADVQFFALQFGERAADLEPWLDRPNVTSLHERIGPFEHALAAARSLDLVITVDTAMAHLAGAGGARVWTLLQYGGEWRWLDGRDDSPWYPTMRLFRQPAAGAWTDVIAAVREALLEVIATGPGHA